MLKKLETRGFVRSKADLGKQTKRPRGRVYGVTQVGRAALEHALEASLSGAREHEARFKIALSGIDVLGRGKAVACLIARADFLQRKLARVRCVAAGQQDLPLAAQLIFDHTEHGIGGEIAWVNHVVAQLQQGGGGR